MSCRCVDLKANKASETPRVFHFRSPPSLCSLRGGWMKTSCVLWHSTQCNAIKGEALWRNVPWNVSTPDPFPWPDLNPSTLSKRLAIERGAVSLSQMWGDCNCRAAGFKSIPVRPSPAVSSELCVALVDVRVYLLCCEAADSITFSLCWIPSYYPWDFSGQFIWISRILVQTKGAKRINGIWKNI